ncbi:FAD binding domain-containing protein [Nocardioides marmoribigeumensis]|uniref:Carbon-monoxide dehydrogenase medium subunit n=1 Tax=Nocardioides marmoribigeumensis TaxID=433649 RepID=A0ABU2BTI9_9ACTN|nr:xanthine dehydrogenase family protein subunit M [Nocardioides marmoribigeumensis]MDR7361596.1 carbon-monoxide dehydrogenase medium subunit [Nocardioides marmoribigeumensis]
MIPAAFDYKAPTTVEEALSAMAEAGDDGKVIAGGQSLLPVMRMRMNAPEVLIDLGKVSSLRGISDEGDSIRIGAMTTYQSVLDDASVKEHLVLLHKVVETIADPQIRHRGTLGGSVAHADPAGDVGAATLALEATMVIAGSGGEREVPASEFFKGLFDTAVDEGELLVALRFPKHTGWGAHYEKFVRVAHQWAIVAVAATVKADGGTISEARVAFTNMGDRPLRATSVEQALAGASATEDAVRQACASAADGTSPPSDLNGDADYRRSIAPVLTRRAVLAAAEA